MFRRSKSDREPILCYVTDRHLFLEMDPAKQRGALLHKIEAAAVAGLGWIQIREKDLSGRDCAALVRAALQCAAQSSRSKNTRTRILVNDRVDVALAERAGGVHLGENSLSVQEVKRLASSHGLGKEFLIGASCHSLEAAKLAASHGANYIFFGPVFATPSKASYGAPQGLERLAAVCRAVSIPVLAIGGVTLANGAACLAAGAAGIAAIRLFQDAADVSEQVAALRRTLSFRRRPSE